MNTEGIPSFLRQQHGRADNEAIRIVAELIAGILLYGGIGWLADSLLGVSFLKYLGCLAGVGLVVYLVIKRHGHSED